MGIKASRNRVSRVAMAVGMAISVVLYGTVSQSQIPTLPKSFASVLCVMGVVAFGRGLLATSASRRRQRALLTLGIRSVHGETAARRYSDAVAEAEAVGTDPVVVDRNLGQSFMDQRKSGRS